MMLGFLLCFDAEVHFLSFNFIFPQLIAQPCIHVVVSGYDGDIIRLIFRLACQGDDSRRDSIAEVEVPPRLSGDFVCGGERCE